MRRFSVERPRRLCQVEVNFWMIECSWARSLYVGCAGLRPRERAKSFIIWLRSLVWAVVYVDWDLNRELIAFWKNAVGPPNLTCLSVPFMPEPMKFVLLLRTPFLTRLAFVFSRVSSSLKIQGATFSKYLDALMRYPSSFRRLTK